jgi:cobalt/nickel transport system permease protein
MPTMLALSLWAVHIDDGFLAWPWWSGGFVVASIFALVGAWRIQDEEIPQIAILTAALFVASLIHVPVPPTSVHLLLNGLVGVTLGRRAALAIPVGLFLQAALLGHGGLMALGINSCILLMPALLAWQMFALLQRIPLLRPRWFAIGLVIGLSTALATILLNCLVLTWGGQADLSTPAKLVLLANLPTVPIEGIILGFTMNFLALVKPELLGLPLPEKRECAVESVS